MIDVFVKLRAKPKARPRVVKGRAYMPPEYQQWRRDFGVLLKSEIAKVKSQRRMIGPVELYLSFYGHGVRIQVNEVTTVRRKHVRGDIDNLLGAVMEVLEDIEVVTNDSKVYRVVANVADNLEVDDDTD
jgi:Holliday junction resolvase RusA-like endonuclease